ncbi:glycoside hydrolase family 88 protein [Flagellimonas sp. HMM57]|uniref:glycoside hydrolase family 88 protein n=1 Tax=unclassified Flagellimonas TaxID=2644544 RepID=UPI0013D5826B|nr:MULTISPECIES: glycoside hydrolase family 88 protein [unclassified Flagellimonas]UII76122.1 glycoside hydrolase family 88 protein [Flagellimonas sp. HMM57]
MLLVILFILLILILLFYSVEIHPYIIVKLRRRFFMYDKKTPLQYYETGVLKAALRISKNETPKMSLADNTYFPIVLVRLFYLKLRKNNRLKNSFPRAFLINGIYDFAERRNDESLFVHIEKILSPFVKGINNGDIKIGYVDQVSMGVVLLKLFNRTKKNEYKLASDLILEYVTNSIHKKHNIILYRKGKDFHYVDVLGMVCPFLYLYAKTFNRPDLTTLANDQLLYYMKNGLAASKFPFHGIELETLTPIGSSNWGRGLGWYMLGLSAALAYTSEQNNPKYPYLKKEMDNLNVQLEKFKNNHHWGQFLGISKKWHTDTSVSCMLIYSLNIADYSFDDNAFYTFIKPLTSKNGLVDFTSGDTEDINIYSREYGHSELTQGLLLSILSKNTNISS